MSADTLRVLTLSPLWAWAMVRLGKDVENRVRRWAYRGPVLIHSAKTCTRAKWEADRLAIEAIIGRCLTGEELAEAREWAGKIIAVTEIVDCVDQRREAWNEMYLTDHAAYLRGDEAEQWADSPWYADGQFGYILRDTQPLTPTPYTGGLGPRRFDHSEVSTGLLADIDAWMSANSYTSERDYDTGLTNWKREARP